jgi:nitroreductase
MELMEAIKARRSVRAYKPDAVVREKIEKILDAAVNAPTGMNQQPWAFGVIQDKAVLHDYSEATKAFLLSKIDEWTWLAGYADYFANPEYSVFYQAPALIVIYAKNPTPLAQTDCTLAAENLMLAARDLGLGSCWIGFSTWVLDSPDVKKQMGVPEDYKVVAPIIVGYPAGDIPAPEKNPPEVMYWK